VKQVTPGRPVRGYSWIAGGHSSIEDGTDEDAADGILVVQIRRLRAIPGEVSERAAREAKLSGFVARPGKAVFAPPMRARKPIF
jgi:hypothetical protein